MPKPAQFIAKIKKRKLITAYIKNPVVSAAAKEADIDPRAANALLKMPDVIKQIDEELSQAAREAGVSRRWVLEKLRTVAERCMQGEPVLDREGNETGEWRFDSGGANRALELIGKHLKLFVDEEKAAAQLGTAVIRLLAQEAQAARLAQTTQPPDHTHVPTTIDDAQERVPPSEGSDVLAPGQADHGGDEPFNPVSPQAPTPL